MQVRVREGLAGPLPTRCPVFPSARLCRFSGAERSGLLSNDHRTTSIHALFRSTLHHFLFPESDDEDEAESRAKRARKVPFALLPEEDLAALRDEVERVITHRCALLWRLLRSVLRCLWKIGQRCTAGWSA